MTRKEKLLRILSDKRERQLLCCAIGCTGVILQAMLNDSANLYEKLSYQGLSREAKIRKSLQMFLPLSFQKVLDSQKVYDGLKRELMANRYPFKMQGQSLETEMNLNKIERYSWIKINAFEIKHFDIITSLKEKGEELSLDSYVEEINRRTDTGFEVWLGFHNKIEIISKHPIRLTSDGNMLTKLKLYKSKEKADEHSA